MWVFETFKAIGALIDRVSELSDFGWIRLCAEQPECSQAAQREYALLNNSQLGSA